MPQFVPSHVALPLAGVPHGVHIEPQVSGSVLLTHTLPQRWKPATQLKPHVEPSHVAVAFAGGVQGIQEAPHVAIDVLLAQAAPHW